MVDYEKRNQELVRDYLDGVSLNKLSEKYGVSRQRVHQIVTVKNVHRDSVRKIRLESISVQEIEEMRNNGMTYKAIAKSLGVTYALLRVHGLISFKKYGGTAKKCCICGQILPLEQFHNSSRSNDGKQPKCKKCNYAIVKKYKQIASIKCRSKKTESEIE